MILNIFYVMALGLTVFALPVFPIDRVRMDGIKSLGKRYLKNKRSGIAPTPW